MGNTIDYIAPSPKFIVCDNGIDVYQCVYADTGMWVSTGQPNLNAFDDFASAQAIYGNLITDPTIVIDEGGI